MQTASMRFSFEDDLISNKDDFIFDEMWTTIHFHISLNKLDRPWVEV